jgi:phosphatidylglycerophosphatase A
MKRITISDLFHDPINWLAFGFGSGLAPKAPGTLGTIACFPLYLLLANLDTTYYVLACFAVSLIGIYICEHAAKYLDTHDHPGIVWDEFAGMLITLIAIPFSWTNLILGFVLFRFFDIVKPWPISWLDRKVSGGVGIMLDDIVAGIFALICMHLLVYFI